MMKTKTATTKTRNRKRDASALAAATVIATEVMAAREAEADRGPAAVAMSTTAAQLGASVVRYLRIHRRKPYTKEADIQWIVDRAREAIHAAIAELEA
jgi:hypothetical protein